MPIINATSVVTEEIREPGRADWWNGPYAVFRCPKCSGRRFGSHNQDVSCHRCGWAGSRKEAFWLPPGKPADVFAIRVTAREEAPCPS